MKETKYIDVKVTVTEKIFIEDDEGGFLGSTVNELEDLQLNFSCTPKFQDEYDTTINMVRDVLTKLYDNKAKLISKIADETQEKI